MPDYHCAVCRTTYAAGREGYDAVRDRHRAEVHGGGTPDGELSVAAPSDAKVITGRQVVIAFVFLAIFSLLAKACGFQMM